MNKNTPPNTSKTIPAVPVTTAVKYNAPKTIAKITFMTLICRTHIRFHNFYILVKQFIKCYNKYKSVLPVYPETSVTPLRKFFGFACSVAVASDVAFCNLTEVDCVNNHMAINIKNIRIGNLTPIVIHLFHIGYALSCFAIYLIKCQ